MPRFLFLGLLLTLLFFVRLGDRDFTSSHEARAAQHAQSMLDGDGWGLPRLFNQRVDLQKPPLFYWLVALIGWLRGGVVDPWCVRLPAALSAVVVVAFLVFLGRRLDRPRAGLFAGLILATSLHFTWLARVGRIDMPFTCALTLAIGSHLLALRCRAEGRGGLGWFLGGYLSLAAAVLLKGPLALVLFFLWQVIQSRLDGVMRRSWKLATWWWGYPLVLALALPWYLWANWATGNRLWEVFIVYHNLQRGLGGEENLASQPVWYYLPRLVVDLLPWSLVVPVLLFVWRRGGSETSSVERAGALWFGGFFVFFSLMSFKRADYLLPAFPGFALWLGAYVARHLAQDAPRWRRSLVPGLASLCAVAWIAYVGWLDRETARGWELQRQARDIRAHTDMPVIFFRTEAHALAFHVGRPLDTILEWENLDWWVARPFVVYFVMPAECAAAWPDHLTSGSLLEVNRVEEGERALVVMRSEPGLARRAK